MVDKIITLLILLSVIHVGCENSPAPAVACDITPTASQEDLFQATRVQTAIRDVVLRLKGERPAEELLTITPEQVAALLNSNERKILGEQYLTFRVSVPVTVYVVVDEEQVDDTFWLPERNFEKTNLSAGGREIWKKDFNKGKVGLGVHSLSRRGDQYYAILVPRNPSDTVSVTEITPALHDQIIARVGESYLADDPSERIGQLPADLDGHVMIRGADSRQQEGHLAGFFRKTAYAATSSPDQIILVMTENPKNSITVQWRTSTQVPQGTVRYRKKEFATPSETDETLEAMAETIVIEDIGLLEDPVNHRHLATLVDLEPDTEYVYSVGNGEKWSMFKEFKTAPGGEAPFSFMYMGDIQAGYDQWVGLAKTAKRTAPEAAFCLTAGDQINRGGQRNDWDAWLNYADDIFCDLPIAPTLGNHEMYRNQPKLYLQLFQLPENGDPDLQPERTYWFEYGNLLVVSLDGNSSFESQTDWLETRLAESDATWKVAMFHQPVYSVVEDRQNPPEGKLWTDLFDKYGVDVVFQGHDHGYLRSHPMKNGRRTRDKGEGTIYVVSNAGWKMYDTRERDYGARVINRTPMFQVIDIQVKPDRFVFKAYDKDGNQLDEFSLTKAL